MLSTKYRITIFFAAFTREEFDAWMSRAVPLSIAIGAFSLVITIAEALTSALFEVRGFLDKFGVFSTTFIYSVAAICMFGISLVSKRKWS